MATAPKALVVREPFMPVRRSGPGPVEPSSFAMLRRRMGRSGAAAHETASQPLTLDLNF